MAAASFGLLDQYAGELNGTPLSLARLVDAAIMCRQRDESVAEWPKAPKVLGWCLGFTKVTIIVSRSASDPSQPVQLCLAKSYAAGHVSLLQ